MSVPTSSSSSRKRSSRACDGCKQRRMKCEDIMPSPTTSEPTCRLCREARQECTFETPVRKRGPAPGFRRRSALGGSGSPGKASDSGDEERPEGVSSGGERAPNGGQQSDERTASLPTAPVPARRRRPPLLGLPPILVDEMLAIYFTHVHNVWPLIYKPMFNPHTTSAPLLLSMLAIAACLANPSGKDGYDADKLFAMAETALHHCRNESRIDIIQALMVLSLRQTGCGDKRSAFAYAGRSSCMALNLGLHTAPTAPMDPGEMELRSRVYWNAYVLDKILAEETGRPLLLPYRRSSTPFPSTSEADEFETWPPQIASSAPLPRSVVKITPRRGYVMSYFVWTLRLAMIVEDILDVDITGPPISEPWDQQFADSLKFRHHTVRRAEDIAEQLEIWRKHMPPQLEVDQAPSLSPLPHHVIGLAWYHTAKILLYSRFIKRNHRGNMPEFTSRAHQECSDASEAVVDLLAHLDRHKMLGHVSADAIHMLSIVTLFEAFDASDPDPQLAHRAKVNFAQCCIWLRDFSSSWPAASAHKVFFEALIQGGLKLSSGDLEPPSIPREGISPSSAMSPVVESPSMPEGLRVMGRHLSSRVPPTPFATDSAPVSTPGSATGPNLFQLPQFYWNHLTTIGEPGASTSADPVIDAPVWDWDSVTPGTSDVPLPLEWRPPSTAGSAANPPSNMTNPGTNGSVNGAASGTDGPTPTAPASVPAVPEGFTIPTDWQGAGLIPPNGAADQAAIYAALMSYMVEATKGS